MHEFRVVTRHPELRRRAKVWIERDGDNIWFAFAVVEADGLTLAGAAGASRELTTLDSLISASFALVEWTVELDTARKLRKLELERYRPELREILGQVWGQ